MALVLTPEDIAIIGKILLAALFGAVVGTERRLHGKDVGMRTQSLVCMGAAFFAAVGTSVGNLWIAASVISGIGFIGAGLMFRAQNHIVGMTTAAEIWVMASVGIAIGFGMFIPATVATLFVLVILEPLQKVEYWFLPKKMRQTQ